MRWYRRWEWEFEPWSLGTIEPWSQAIDVVGSMVQRFEGSTAQVRTDGR